MMTVAVGRSLLLVRGTLCGRHTEEGLEALDHLIVYPYPTKHTFDICIHIDIHRQTCLFLYSPFAVLADEDRAPSEV